VGAVQEIVNRLRARGIVVHEWAGWQSRGNGQSEAYVGGLVHHTATAYGMAPAILVDGRSDLAGPLCNFAGNHDGTLTVIAAGPANHAGASGGRSMGPLPVTTSLNRRVVGLEIVYPGASPMTAAQYRTACVWARVVADVCGGGNIESVRAHAETSVTGKWDPGYAPGKTIDMARFRQDAAGAQGADDLTPDERDALYDIRQQLTGSRPVGQFAGWPSRVDPNVKLTVTDYVTWIDKATNEANKALADQQAQLAEVRARLIDAQTRLDALASGGVDEDVLAAKVADRLVTQLGPLFDLARRLES
jgi:hypothetical protein